MRVLQLFHALSGFEVNWRSLLVITPRVVLGVRFDGRRCQVCRRCGRGETGLRGGTGLRGAVAGGVADFEFGELIEAFAGGASSRSRG